MVVLFQGDHASVEIATRAHEQLLQSVGLLNETSRVLSSRPFQGDEVCEGLVIDDYFVIAKVPRSVLVADPSLSCLSTSKKVYAKHEIIGSDDKDIVGSRKAKIIGASVNASEKCQKKGHVLVAAPAEKRYALSWISFQVSQLTHTTDALHLCLIGGWTSALMFRRPFMSILQSSFQLVDMAFFNASSPKLVSLPRKVATELCLLGVLAPLCVADVAVDFCTELFATDASLNKGAIVKSRIDKDLATCLLRCCRSKGGYSKLLSPSQSVLARALDFEENEPYVSDSIKRPLAYRFDFIEVFAGASVVTKEVAALGFTVGPPVDLSFSAELDVDRLHVLEWLIHLVTNGYVKAIMLEPPCTTFSVMRRPALRSKHQPFGFQPDELHTRTGTKLAHRALQLLHFCVKHGVTGVIENPWSSKIKFLPAWKSLQGCEHVALVRCDSCAYGSVHLKSFAFLCAWAEVQHISLRCAGGHKHVLVQGKFTKASATYVHDLAIALAKVMAYGILRLSAFEASLAHGSVDGLESQMLNDLCSSQKWELVSVWTYRVSSHINILELEAVLRLIHKLVKRGVSLRLVILIDSNVVRCAASKGRSSSKALSRALSRLAAFCIIGGLYPVFGFAPTRLNPSDDPTRDVVLRDPTPGLDLAAWGRRDIYRLAALPRLKRWASNWTRLILRMLGPSALDLTDHALYPNCAFPFGVVSDLPLLSELRLPSLEFDATLGYPGEGPLFLVSRVSYFRWILVVLACSVGSSHGVIAPRNAGDFQRQGQRDLRPPLQDGRPVLGVTSKQRDTLISQFESWLLDLGISLENLLEHHHVYIDELNKQLVRYGRVLYSAGRPYNHYAETINSIASKKPAVKRQLQEAWNLAFAWIRDEPTAHHLAMPWQVLLSAISLCFVWGWTDMAGMFALCWGALLRVGEFLQATRKDLLLPCDTCFTNSFALLALKEPKTRFTAARHQCAKLDIPDLLRVVHLAFSRIAPYQKLWQKSGQTLRLRFKQVMSELGLGSVRLNHKTLDLGSLRPGGATWILQVTENSEFLRRRGR